MFRRSHLLILVSTLFALAVLAACGRDEPILKSTAATPSPTTQPAAVAVSTPEGQTAAQEQPIQTPTPGPAPTGTPEPTVEPTIAPPTPEALVPTVEPTPTEPPTPTPLAVSNGEATQADDVSLAPAEELPTVEVVKLLKPSVVQIVTETVGMAFGSQPIPSKGVGTGIVLDTRGHILTNAHVVAGAQTITVTLSDGPSLPADLVGGDLNTDLAVIRIQATDLTPAKLGNSSEVQVGEDVIAIGHALGLRGGPTVSKGVVSALGRTIDTEQATIVDLIQTDASINPGNSGGALVNNRAEVIGINTAIIQAGQGLGFAINIDDAKVVAAQLVDKGFVERGFLGITPLNLTPGLANRLGVDAIEGIAVRRVIEGTAAAGVGLREGDVIVQLGDQPIRNTGELSKFLMAHLPGETIDMVFIRRTTRISTQVTLLDRPAP